MANYKKDTWSRRPKHREGNTRLYRIWSLMKQRCYNPKNHDYKSYGERGIIVCDEWFDYCCFRDWAIENGYSDELTIDRIDNNKGYFPNNCRWTTQKNQSRNKRNTRYLTMDGETKSLAEWVDITGIHKSTIRYRIHNMGWSTEMALSTPLTRKSRKEKK